MMVLFMKIENAVSNWSADELNNLVGQTIVSAYEDSSNDSDYEWGSRTYTFYNIQGNSSSANLRWVGSSNGYYSERVDVDYFEPESNSGD